MTPMEAARWNGEAARMTNNEICSAMVRVGAGLPDAQLVDLFLLIEELRCAREEARHLGGPDRSGGLIAASEQILAWAQASADAPPEK